MNAETVRKELQSLAEAKKAKILSGFFKTGPGEYGEGDVFIGVVVPKIRAVTKKYRDLPLDEVTGLLKSPIHEERLTALLIMVLKFQKAERSEREAIYKLYLKHTKYINNWDLVDLTAEKIIGPWLENGDRSILVKLAKSQDLWERRIAILSTFHFIKQGDPAPTLKIAGLLLYDRQDLIHKAVGWMLREVGKRCSLAAEEEFLRKHHRIMPRTMLRYAIERFPEPLRKKYLKT